MADETYRALIGAAGEELQTMFNNSNTELQAAFERAGVDPSKALSVKDFNAVAKHLTSGTDDLRVTELAPDNASNEKFGTGNDYSIVRNNGGDHEERLGSGPDKHFSGTLNGGETESRGGWGADEMVAYADPTSETKLYGGGGKDGITAIGNVTGYGGDGPDAMTAHMGGIVNGGSGKNTYDIHTGEFGSDRRPTQAFLGPDPETVVITHDGSGSAVLHGFNHREDVAIVAGGFEDAAAALRANGVTFSGVDPNALQACPQNFEGIAITEIKGKGESCEVGG